MLLQITDAGLGEAVADKAQEIHYLELVLSGGWPMVVIGIMSLVSVYVIFSTAISLVKLTREPQKLRDNVSKLAREMNQRDAIRICQKENSPFSRVLLVGLNNLGARFQDIKDSMEEASELEMYKIEKNLSWLGMIAGAAPTVGFLGTVLGMIVSFSEIAHAQDGVSPSMLAGGIYQAMVTTAAGIVVGLIAGVSYNILTHRVQKVVFNFKTTVYDFFAALRFPDREKAKLFRDNISK
jgi:biopolymer transport protein ExbB